MSWRREPTRRRRRLGNGARARVETRVMARDDVDEDFFTALDARSRALDDALARGTMRVCSWNVQALVGIFRGQGGARADVRARIDRVAVNVLRAAASGAMDVVAFQEVWDDACRTRLREALREAFPFAYAPKARCGLMIFSKFSHVCNHFARLGGASGVEARVFEKGVCSTILRLDGKKRVCVLMNCHLQSDYWSNGRSARVEQLRGVREAFHRVVRECAGNGYEVDRCILCGDLNVEAGSDEYLVMMRSTFPGAIDLMLPPSSNVDVGSFRLTFPVARWRHYVVPCGRESRYIDQTPRTRIDYVLDLTPMVKTDAPPRHARVDSGYVHEAMCRDASGRALSDHFPIIAFSSLYASDGDDSP